MWKVECGKLGNGNLFPVNPPGAAHRTAPAGPAPVERKILSYGVS